MYESPIKIIESTIDSFSKAIIKQRDDAIFAEIQSSFGVDLDKKELIRALQYDRNQYEKGYADGKATQEWISVKDRLPEVQERVLAVTESGYIRMDCIRKCDGTWFQELFDSSKITHWMPLPEPPKGE